LAGGNNLLSELVCYPPLEKKVRQADSNRTTGNFDHTIPSEPQVEPMLAQPFRQGGA
jgi:hypothetical protein